MKLSINFKILWDSLNGIKSVTNNVQSCIHSGNAGDIIYSLPIVKKLGAQHYVINLNSDPAITGRGITFETAKALAPLLLIQPYIERVTIAKCNVFLEYLDLDQPTEGIDYLLDRFHLQQPDKHHLGISYAIAFRTPVNLYEKWFSVEEKEDYIVVALTPRYRSLPQEFWVKVLSGPNNIIFLGIPKEFHCMAGTNGNFVTCKDFVEIIKIINGSKFFIGNPSLPYAIAEALKVPKLVELPYQPRNTFPIGKNGYAVPTSIRETKKLIDHIISDSKEKKATHFQQNKTNKISHRNVSIVMPVFNKLEYTTQCIDALYKVTPNNSFELIVVNNASTDGTKEYLNKLCNQMNNVKVIHNDTNLGFAKACNQGAGIAKRKYLVFLNNDTVPLKSWLESMLEVVENEDNVGVVGSKLLFPDNTIQHAGIEVTDWPLPVFPFHIYYRWPSNSIEANKKMDYLAVTGACLLTPKQLFNELEGFDEGFLNGCEDTDYCFRVREKGLRVVYTPKSVLYHYESVTDGRFKAVKENKKRLLTKWKGRITVKHNQVGIVVLSYSGAKNTIECLESIDKNTNYKIFQVILVDNVSREDDIRLIESWKKETGYEFIFIRNHKNLGLAGGSNVGIKKALEEGADFVWLLNNDTVVEKGTLENLLAFGKSHNIGMISSKIYSYFDRSKVQYNGEKICYLGMPDINNDKLSLVDFAPACSVLIPKEVFKKIGFLDEDYFFYCEDNDFCKRLKTAGFQILYNPLSKVYHKCNASSIGSWLKSPSPISAYYATRNLLYFAGDKYEEILSECFFHLEKFYWKNLEKGSSYIKGFVEGIKDHILRKKGRVNSEQLDTDFWIDWPDKELEKIAKKLVFSIDKTKFFEFLSLSQEILLKNIKQKSKDKAYHLCEKGEEKYENGDIEKAIILFEEAIKLDNTCHTAYNNLAAIYWQMQDIEMSHCFINKAIELAPKDPNVLWNYKQIKSKAHAVV